MYQDENHIWEMGQLWDKAEELYQDLRYEAEAAIRQMKPKTLPYFSTKNDLVVRKIIYEIQGE